MTAIPYNLLRRLRGLPENPDDLATDAELAAAVSGGAPGPASRSVFIGDVSVVNPLTEADELPVEVQVGESVIFENPHPAVMAGNFYAHSATGGVQTDAFNLLLRYHADAGDRTITQTPADSDGVLYTDPATALLFPSQATIGLFAVFAPPLGQTWEVTIPSPNEGEVDPTWMVEVDGLPHAGIPFDASSTDVATIVGYGWHVDKGDAGNWSFRAPADGGFHTFDAVSVAYAYTDADPSASLGNAPMLAAPATVDLTNTTLFIVTESPA